MHSVDGGVSGETERIAMTCTHTTRIADISVGLHQLSHFQSDSFYEVTTLDGGLRGIKQKYFNPSKLNISEIGSK